MRFVGIYGILLLLHSLHLVCLKPCMDEGHFRKGDLFMLLFQKRIVTSSYLQCRLHIWKFSHKGIWKAARRELILMNRAAKTSIRLNSITFQRHQDMLVKNLHIFYPGTFLEKSFISMREFFLERDSKHLPQISALKYYPTEFVR